MQTEIGLPEVPADSAGPVHFNSRATV